MDDTPVVAGDHVRHNRAAAIKSALHVDMHHVRESVGRKLPHLYVWASNAGIVNQHIDLAIGVEHGLSRVLDRGEVADVSRNNLHMSAAVKFGSGMFETILVDRPDANVCSGGQ